MKKILIVGGVTGGASAAARLRRLNEEDEIILFERSEHTGCAGCGLPYYIGGVIEERRKLLQTVSGLAKRYRLDIRCGSEVLSINRDDKSITVRKKRRAKPTKKAMTSWFSRQGPDLLCRICREWMKLKMPLH